MDMSLPTPEQNKLIVDRDVAPGEEIIHAGPIVITGRIGEGAHVESTDGGVTVRKDVEDGVTIRAVLQEGNPFAGGSGGIRIKGSTGNRVTLDTDGRVRGTDFGDDLIANVGIDFKADSVGARGVLDAGTDIVVDRIGADAGRIDAGRDLTADEIGPGGYYQAMQDIKVVLVREQCRLLAGRDIDAAQLEEEVVAAAIRNFYARKVKDAAECKAGRNMTIHMADPGARLAAMGSIKTREAPLESFENAPLELEPPKKDPEVSHRFKEQRFGP